MSEVNGNKSKNKKKKNRKESDVMCWNCFTSEDSDSNTLDIEPITLPKVREEHREKLKVYSFLASELSKPKAVSLKQKISEPYKIGKKIDAEILKQQSNIPDSENISNQDSADKNIDNSTIDLIEDVTKSNLQGSPDKQQKHQNSILSLQEKITPKNVLPITHSQKETGMFNISDSTRNNITKEGECIKDMMNQNSIQSHNSLLISRLQKLQNDDKPKAVSLKQKISEPYKIGKKIDAEILKQQSNIPDSENISNHDSADKNIDNSTIDHIEDVTKSNLQDFPDKQQVHQNSILSLQEKITPKNVLPITHSQKETGMFNISDSTRNNITKEGECIKDMMNQNSIQSHNSLLISRQQKLQNDDKHKYTSERKITDLKSIFERPSSTSIFTFKESEKITPPVINEEKEKTSVVKMTTGKLGPYNEIPCSKTSTLQTNTMIILPTPTRNLYNASKSFEGTNCTETFVEKKSVYVPSEFPKITPIKFRNKNTDSKIPVLKESPPKVFNETIVKDNLTVRSNHAVSNLPDKSTEKEIERVTNKNIYQDIKSLKHKENVIDSDKIVHKVQILTSTPKQKCIVINETSREDDTVNSEINLSETKEEIKLNSDKIDNASSNGSESGYTGSLATVLEFAIDESQEESKENENIYKHVKETKKDLESSFHSLNTVNKKPPTHSSSLSTGINNVGKKPKKSSRWSTLSRVPRSVSFEDEVYTSEAVSPGHATLPRRSNSPLPHERDVDRDRFPINRSGLQARSESMASVYSGAGEGLRGSVTVRGEVQFSLLYNYRLGALEVGVKRCRDLAPVDVKRNRSDPYVKVYLLPDKSKAGKRKTKVKKNTLNPVFEETLSFVQPLASLSARTLWLSAWHADMFGRNDFLGEVTLPLADVVFDDPAPMWYKLHERTEQFDEQQGSRGDLIVGLKFELSDAARGAGTLHVLVKEAKNLVATKPNGLADVFCKSYLLPERGRLAKQKTTVVRRSLNPRWEHTFTYRNLTLQELATRALELSLWDRDRLASNDFMGAVRLSLATGTYMGVSVNWMDSVGKEITLWQNMMQQPNLWVEGSLPLRPQLIN